MQNYKMIRWIYHVKELIPFIEGFVWLSPYLILKEDLDLQAHILIIFVFPFKKYLKEHIF